MSCGVCGVAAALSCGGCAAVVYCSKQHQRQHWAQHKPMCLPFKTCTSDHAGKYLVATRNLQAGQLVFRDAPLVVGPLAVSPLVCLGCHAAITHQTFARCPDCHWPMCSPECSRSGVHLKECLVLRKDGRRIGPPLGLGPATPRYDAILVLRCLALQHDDAQGWSAVADMVSHAQHYANTRDLVHMATSRYLKEVLQVDHDEAAILQARGALAANSLEIRTKDGMRLRALYPRVRLMNHSCLPNIQLRYDTEGVMEVRAAVNIEKGQALNITYTSTSIPLWERQKILQDTYCFRCECVRCSDPTELGLHFSSPRCPECPKRFLEPRVWVDCVTWQCETCTTKLSDEDVHQHAKEWTQRLEMDDLFAGFSVKQILRSLDQVAEEFHGQHHVWMTAAQVALVELRKQDSVAAWQARADLWQRLLALIGTLEPGMSRRRGVLLLEAGAVAAEAVRREWTAGDGFVPQLLTRLTTAAEQLQEAQDILALEPPRATIAPMVTKARDKLSGANTLLAELQKEQSRTNGAPTSA